MTRIFEPNVKIPNTINGAASGVKSASSKDKGEVVSLTSGQDQVTTDSQSQLLALASAAGDTGASQRVQDLRALVHSGQYRVDSNALSGAILDAMSQGY